MKVLLVGPLVVAVTLLLSASHDERRATATVKTERVSAGVAEAKPPTPKPEPTPSEAPPAARTISDPQPKPEKASTLTPMGRREAVSFLAKAWRESQGEEPSDPTVAVLCAHWSHETDHGRRMHAYNFGGIKGVGPSGASLVIWTRENGETERLVRRTFRAYASPEEGARDYVNLLAERYSAAFRAAREASIERFVTGLGSRGYFTDDEQTYLRSLARLVRDCARDLERVRAP